MEERMLSYFKIIGQMQTSIAKADSLETALHDGISIILKACSADYALVWLKDAKDNNVLYPYYWICPMDFTGMSHRTGEGTVGRVFRDQKTEKYLEYDGNDPETDKDFRETKIGSMVCVPLSNNYDNLGCVQFVNVKGNACFSDEDADVFEMFSMFLAIGIDERTDFVNNYKDKKTIISVRNLTKEFKNGEIVTKVLKGVNLNIYEGEFVTLLGESGCGKSTLLNIIGGLDDATEGELEFMGKDITHASEEELTCLRRDNIGFIFQSYNLMPNLNARQNLDLIAEHVKDPLDSVEALRRVGMDQKAENYPSQLSGGQQQRISIARAIVKNPKIIIADEPTAALDYETSIVILEALHEAAKNGITLVMVTHNEEITKMSDRVVRFRNGKVFEVKVNKHPVSARELVW